MIHVIDLSHHNVIPESLQKAKEWGVYGVIHKATESTTFSDPKLGARYRLAKQAGMLWGIYHFIRPGSVEAQVRYFLKYAASQDAVDTRTLFVLDFEDKKVSLDDCLLFLQMLEREANCQPIIYSGHDLKEKMADRPLMELTKYRLWVAQYGPTVKLPVGWDRYFLWQYTDTGQVPGITPPTDLNKFDGDPIELEAAWTGGWPEPAPTPPNPPGEKVVRVSVPKGMKVVIEEQE
jgi:lysozyme